MDRRVASVLFVTGIVLSSASALAPTPALAAAVTATPDHIPNTATAQEVDFNVGSNATLYSLGASVVMTGPGSGTDSYTGTNTSVSGSTVKATFNLVGTGGLPAAPGVYAVALKTLGGAIPLDTSSVTVTALKPTINASAALPPGTTTPITITATTNKFAKGDTVSFTPGTGTTGLSISSVTVGATKITGTLHAAADAGPGTYNVVVTDTAGDPPATCEGCVIVGTGPHAVTGLRASNVGPHSASLSWTPPTGSPAATGYQVVVSTSSTATTTDAGIKVTHTPSAATATVSGLKQATKYYVTVTPTSSDGPGTRSAPYSFFTSEPSFLTFSHTLASLQYGMVLTLSGNLSTTDNAPLALQPIKLYSKIGSGAATVLKIVKTTADGNYEYSFKPRHNASYVAYFPGAAGTSDSPAIGASIGKVFKGTVGQRITLKGTAKHNGQWLQLSGKVAPNEAGRKVTIYQKVHGNLHKFATAKLSPKSTYKKTFKHLGSGRYALYAIIKPTALNTRGKSPKLTVTRP
jgi:hypothetical protein